MDTHVTRSEIIVIVHVDEIVKKQDNYSRKCIHILILEFYLFEPSWHFGHD